MAQYAAAQPSPLSPTAPSYSTPSHHTSSSSVGPGAVRDETPHTVGEGDGDNSARSSQHKRVYQACIPCRRRKVRCDLGSVDNPHDPPCVRCRRESKQCFFSATRRKRKADDGSAVDDAGEADNYVARNSRKQPRLEDTPVLDAESLDRRPYKSPLLTPGGSQFRRQPLRRPEDGSKSSEAGRSAGLGGVEPNTPLENLEARTVMRREVYGPHDALDLLYKAATDNSVKGHDVVVPGYAGTDPSPMGSHSHMQEMPNPTDVVGRRLSMSPGKQGRSESVQRPPREGPATAAIDPELTKHQPADQPGYEDALEVWGRFRFVRAGWFTAQEAINYIEYYYAYLSPLTPISPPTFRSPASHLTLLTEEPILTVTLLTIASRYCPVKGPGGHCRSHAIHEQLWTYLRGMIERVVWGQEAFGGGFCGTGADEMQNSSTAPWRGLRRGSLRTLGTIESLMILTEWHPRALHFPPNEAIDELLLPSYEAQTCSQADDEQGPPAGFGGRRIESWLEPAWRSDRMCWMLLSIGMGLAYELGVFDDIDELLAAGAIARPEYEDEAYRLRAFRIKRLLLIYLTQLAGRLGWTNMVPEHLRKSDSMPWKRRPTSMEGPEGATPATNPSSTSNAFNYIPDVELDDQIIHCWAGISSAMQLANDKLFRCRKHTTHIIQNGDYIDLLRDLQPIMQDWWQQFERLRMPPYIRHILTIEYDYVRIYINSLSLQAVVERCTSIGIPSSDPHLSPHTQNFLSKAPLASLGGFGERDREYVKEVVDGSRNLLKTVVEHLLPDDYLKHAPVRTYFRIISGAMFLLKTFALGAPRSDVEISIGLMDRTVDGLRNCVVDDVHLGTRFADMLETLTSRLRNRFIHAPPPPIATADNASTTHGRGSHRTSAPASESWAKKDEMHGSERSCTPFNISATPWDTSTGNFPYPSDSVPGLPGVSISEPAGLGGASGSNTNAGNDSDGGAASADNSMFGNSDWNDPGTEMWYLPAGPGFFQNMENQAVAMTAEGVKFGGLDLLEYMAMDPMDPMDPNYNVMDGNTY